MMCVYVSVYLYVLYKYLLDKQWCIHTSIILYLCIHGFTNSCIYSPTIAFLSYMYKKNKWACSVMFASYYVLLSFHQCRKFWEEKTSYLVKF